MSEQNSPSERQSIHGQWSSRIVFILAVSGSAVGLGNIWRFPYVAGMNGGGAFVLVYLGCIFAIGLPIMISEIMLGRKGRRNPMTSMELLGQEETGFKAWKYAGLTGLLAGFLILSYYSVIAGWTLNYFILTAQGVFDGIDPSSVDGVFNALTLSIKTQVLFHTIFMALTVFIIANGIKNGLERAVMMMMPMLFIIILVLLIYAITQGNFSEGLNFMFRPDFSKFDGSSLLIAMGQAFFTLSLGMGCVFTYGAYLPKEESIFKSSIAIILCDTSIALLAGMVIFPIVFSYDLEAAGGPGLIFQTLPLAFGQISGGRLFGSLFFILLGFAALTSAISLLEPSVAWMVEKKNVSRKISAMVIGLGIWALGILTVLSFNELSNFTFWKGTIFDNFDYLSSNILLPISGFLFTIFAGWFMSKKSSSEELDGKNSWAYRFWRFLARYVAPIAVLLIFLNAIGIY
ncbi:MAG: sodium-dependent transporter [Gammaproteobacteria bacterium]|nr:sodium-dependent transporter [Gammaproteobacteria bacterium]